MAKLTLSAFADEYADNFEEQLKALNGFGIGYIELRFINGKNIADLSYEEVAEVKDLLQKYNIKASAIGSPLGKIKLDDDFDAHLAKAEQLFKTANELGVENIRMFSFYPADGEDIANCEALIFAKLQKLVDLAEKYNVTLCHENEAKIFGESPENCLKVAKQFEGKIKCVFDMGNFVLDGYKPYPDALSLLSDYIEYFHIKDSLYEGAIVPPGKGNADILNILKNYGKKTDRDIFITLEPHLQTFSGLNALVGKQFDNPYKYPDKETAFCDAVDKIKEILKQL